jgi:hypothetical protein
MSKSAVDDWIGQFNFVLRHSSHHQDQLASLVSYHGHAGGSRDL